MSSQRLDCEVAVIGAGPAGSAAAHHAARAGFDTVLIDAAAFPRDKTCGDGLTPRAMHQLERMGIDLGEHSYRHYGLKLHGFGGSLTAPWPTSYPVNYGSAMDRYRFDDLLRRAATDAGARMITGQAQQPQLSGNSLESFQVTGPQPVQVHARWVIVADGVRSSFGKELGRQWDRTEVYAVAARSYATSPHADEPWLHSHLELRDEAGNIQPGYGWIFPLGSDSGQVNIGCGALSTASRPAQLNTKKVLRHYAAMVRQQWELGAPHDIASALLPMGGAVRGVAGANWALIGDAAACVNPLNGEGIDYGLETAELVMALIGSAAQDRRPDLTYAWPDLLLSHYGQAFALARAAARLLTVPHFLAVTGPVALRGPLGRLLMPAAARLMGNLVTEADQDLLARLWRLAGNGSLQWALRRENSLWSQPR